MKLYHYWRSSSSWRVRWALEYKKIPCELVAVNLLNGESESLEHRNRHPRGAVPVLELEKNQYLIESLAIIDYLDRSFQDRPSLYPENALDRARSLALAELINSGIHPLQNPTVTAYLQDSYSLDGEAQKKWIQHWIQDGLSAFERLADEGSFSIGNQLSIADLCLIPQLYNARRYEVSLEGFPKILNIEKNLLSLESCIQSHPDRFKPI